MTMQPPATSISAPCDTRGRDGAPRRRGPSRPRALVRIAALALGLAACGGDEWPDRDPLVVESAPIDSLEFLPRDTRFILADSLTLVHVRGFRLGYACTRILSLDLVKQEFNQPAGFTARLRLELPGSPECALDDSLRNDTLSRRFALSEGPEVILLDDDGNGDDTAWVVPGTERVDSLTALPGSLTGVFEKDGIAYYDTLQTALKHLVIAGSLGPCGRLSRAERATRGKDTTVVRYTVVTLDSAAAPGVCGDVPRSDTVPAVPARP